MTYRFAGLSLLSALGALPMLQLSCSGSERNFVETDGSAGTTTGGTAGTAGSTAGTAGTTAGTAGTPSGGSSGTGDAGVPCANSAECDDGETCNGTETCAGGYCAPGTAEADGTSCTPDFGDAGIEESDAGVTYACVSAKCSLRCETDADCNDNSVCTGNEICDPTDKICLSGTPPVCEDNNDCTSNDCDPVSGCVYPIIDVDGDGHAATTIGACGTDCDDADATRYVGAAELCDEKDNNCNGSTDEGSPLWYPDCDKDGFAPTGTTGTPGCTAPPTAPTVCTTGGWTTKAPGAGTTDCWDKDPKAHPMTPSQNLSAYQSVPMSGSPPTNVDYDYNCDGLEERRWTDTYSSTASCAYSKIGFYLMGMGGTSGFEPSAAGGTGGIGGIGGVTGDPCVGEDGWVGGTVPACGGTADFSNCYYVSTLGCQRRTTTGKKQECR